MRQDLGTYSSEYPFHDIRTFLVAQPWSFQRKGTYFDHCYGQRCRQRSLRNRRYCDSAHVLQPKLGHRIPTPALPVLATHRLRFRWHGPPVPRLAICHAVPRCSRELRPVQYAAQELRQAREGTHVARAVLPQCDACEFRLVLVPGIHLHCTVDLQLGMLDRPQQCRYQPALWIPDRLRNGLLNVRLEHDFVYR